MDDQTKTLESSATPLIKDNATAASVGKQTLSEANVNGEIANYNGRNTNEKDCICTKQQQINCKKTVSDLNGVRSPVRISELELSNQSEVNDVKSTTTKLEQAKEVVETRAGETRTTAIEYVGYENELQMEAIMALITKDLSEPYSVYTYRYFIHNWPKLCFLVSIYLLLQ